MIKFHGFCQGKIMVRKMNFFEVCVDMSNFFANILPRVT